MISRIQNEPKLKSCIRYEIEDEGIEVGVDEKLTHSEYAGVKVDDYYNGLHDATPPKATDYVVAVDNSCDSYNLYILEMKNVKEPKFLDIRAIQDKFSTTINDFLSIRFKDIFLSDKYKYKDICLYLVSDAYGAGGSFHSHEEYRKYLEKIDKKDSLKVDNNLGRKIYKFRNRFLTIQYNLIRLSRWATRPPRNIYGHKPKKYYLYLKEIFKHEEVEQE